MTLVKWQTERRSMNITPMPMKNRKHDFKEWQKMIDWIINATGDQIVTVIIMIWLIIAMIKIYVKEKNDGRN